METKRPSMTPYEQYMRGTESPGYGLGGPVTPDPVLAEPLAEAPYVIDRNLRVWAVVRDGGILTRATYEGQESCGIRWAEDNLGPLVPFDPAYVLGKGSSND